MKDILILSI